jgi:ABC-2 type transport system permease protein
MLTIFRHSLAKSRGQILGWGLSLALLGAYMYSFYDTFSGQQEQMQALLANYPPELMAFFGDMGNMFTPEGYLTVEFFSYMPLVLGIYAVLIASGLIASEEESGVLDLVIGHPVSRSGYFFGRLLAFITSTALMFTIIWLSFVIADSVSTLDISPLALAQPFLSLFAVILLFGTLALLLSQLFPSRRLTAMITGLVVVASFFITSLATIDENLETAARFSPLNYYQSGEAINGLDWGWLGGLFGVAVLFTLLAWWRFQHRDLRVGGEGSWSLRLRKSPRTRTAMSG